ncbi:MAG TPA: tetratricopeptide repeat protein, partial [Ktedonobacterales bacterium]|nr:tetratricopeptide repeat protein [Ktedonobacterales bacterium]
LGEGGMGSVYKVEDVTLPGRFLALKELLDDATLPPEERAAAVKRFDDEIALLRRLHHPRIPSFEGHFLERGQHYFLMELIAGVTLEDLQAQRHSSLPEYDVLSWMCDVCDVLSYLHAQHPPIIVRDLKPGNIMVTSGGDVFLIDFGIARTYKAGKQSNTENLGTAIYASPEHHGHGQTDARSDIYSLGATMYHLLTNVEPAPMETPRPGSLRRHAPDVSEATERLIIRAMELDPARRFPDAEAMRQAMRQALLALPPAAQAGRTRITVAGSTTSAPSLPRSAAPSYAPSAPASPSTRGSSVAAQPAVAPAPAHASRQATSAGVRAVGLICPRCGFVNRSNAKFCARDGTPLRPGIAPRSRAGKPAAAPVTKIVPASTAELHAQRATESFGAGRFQQAIRQAEEAIAQGRGTYDLYLLLGRARRSLNWHLEAARAFEQAARLQPTAEALTLEGLSWRDAGDLTAAQIALTKARVLDPHNADIPSQLGLICLQQGMFSQAEGELSAALEIQRNWVPALIGMGQLREARKEWPEAIASFRQATAVAPSDASAHLELGRALLATHKPAEAVRELEQAARLAPQSAEALTALGVALSATGKRNKARDALRKALNIDPTSREAREMLDHM